MEEMLICQSCGMPLTKTEEFGNNADGSPNREYCCYCFKDGNFTDDSSMEEMIEFCVPHCSNGNPYANEEEARKALGEYFPTLKRWKK